MRKKIIIPVCFISISVMLTACYAQAQTADAPVQLRLLSTYVIPHGTSFQGTTVGGLSGIDYDPEHNIYYMISDDRSAFNPVRFYTANITLSDGKIDTVLWCRVYFLQRADGSLYPPAKQDIAGGADPESIRYWKQKRLLLWSSEGDVNIADGNLVMAQPVINMAYLKGKYVKKEKPFVLPKNIQYYPGQQRGVRRNGALEGLTIGTDGRYLFAAMEEPLYEDGPPARHNSKQGACVRILKLSTDTRTTVAQFAYRVDPVAHPPDPPEAQSNNGISEILWINDHRLWIVERSYAVGRSNCTIKIYDADLSSASDITDVISLVEAGSVEFIKKRLLLDSDTLGIYVDNIEGITFGPTLPNGHATILLLADDNFSTRQQSQLMLFDVTPYAGGNADY